MKKTQFPLVLAPIQLKLLYSWSESFEQWEKGNNVQWLLNAKHGKKSWGMKIACGKINLKKKLNIAADLSSTGGVLWKKIIVFG